MSLRAKQEPRLLERELVLVIPGAPRTKKNHGNVIKRGKRKFHVPSDAYQSWNAGAQASLAKFRAECRLPLPIRVNVNCCAHFYRHANVGDAVGFYQALADALEEGGILENDRRIVSWNGSMLLKSKQPRIEVYLEVANP